MISVTFFLFGLGLAASLILAVAAKVFYVWEDPKIEQIGEALLGANCGACGYAGCASAAEAVVNGTAPADVCTAGGFAVAQDVAQVLGLTIEEKEPEVSMPGCTYGYQDAELKYTYDGVMDCRAAMQLFGGSKECFIGCLGLGTCVRACPFGALSMGPDNLPIVNKEKCTACGICTEVCPKDIITLTSASKRIMSDYKTTECTAPCQRNCPAEIDIPEYIKQISNGNYRQAVTVIKEKNPFPLICGWICPAPCERDCRRNLVDEPVNINGLKKFVSEYEMKSGEHILPDYLPLEGGKNIAVIGGGVSGLTAAYYLRRLGNSPKVIEATKKLGGVLRYVITEERLPRKVLDWDIEGILATGIETETGKVMGRDFTLTSLFEDGIDMVLLTIGGWDSHQIMQGRYSGNNIIPGTDLLLDFLLHDSRNENMPSGQNAVIIGGGDAAYKAAAICLENGANKVTIAHPYSEHEAVLKGFKPNKTKNIVDLYCALPIELRGDGDQLLEITIRTAGEKIEKVALDSLIVGSGRYPELLITRTEGQEWKTVEILKVLTEEPDLGIFSMGETGRTSDYNSVVTAVRRGRKMARALQLHISGEDIAAEEGVISDQAELQNIYEIEYSEPLKVARINYNSAVTLTEAEVKTEAGRCFDCGLICYNRLLIWKIKQRPLLLNNINR